MGAPLQTEIAASAARLVVDEGMEYAQAKRKAVRALGRHAVRPAEMPSNEAIEEEVRAYIQLFCADTQPTELRALRELALQWMERLAEFRPHLAGAVWRGTATRLSAVHLDLYCDDPKSAEIALINQRIDYDHGVHADARGAERSVLSLAAATAAWADPVTVHLTLHDHDDLRGALKADARGRTWRGDASAVRRLLRDAEVVS